MSDDRKYRQRGYQDHGSAPAPRREGPAFSSPGSRFTAFREAVHCDGCGTGLSPHVEYGTESTCPKCGAALHTCRMCRHLDPGARFQCMRPVTARVGDKRAANVCTEFEVRRVQVKETTSSAAPGPDAARRAFENLFKKR